MTLLDRKRLQEFSCVKNKDRFTVFIIINENANLTKGRSTANYKMSWELWGAMYTIPVYLFVQF